VTVAGGTASGELLVSVTAAPAGGAAPFSVTNAVAGLLPVIRFGEGPTSFSDGGFTVTGTLAADPAYVAVMVAAVGAVTCPYTNRNWVKAVPAPMSTDDGTGVAPGCVLVSWTSAPPAGAGPVSWSSPTCSVPLKADVMPSKEIDAILAGAVLTVNERTVDHAVIAAVVGDASPWVWRTRQYFVPELRPRRVY